jgi:hypothetical protein
MVEYDITGRISCTLYPSGEDFRRSEFERLREMVFEGGLGRVGPGTTTTIV